MIIFKNVNLPRYEYDDLEQILFFPQLDFSDFGQIHDFSQRFHDVFFIKIITLEKTVRSATNSISSWPLIFISVYSRMLLAAPNGIFGYSNQAVDFQNEKLVNTIFSSAQKWCCITHWLDPNLILNLASNL